MSPTPESDSIFRSSSFHLDYLEGGGRGGEGVYTGGREPICCVNFFFFFLFFRLGSTVPLVDTRPKDLSDRSLLSPFMSY